jgi:hypothetical protein
MKKIAKDKAKSHLSTVENVCIKSGCGVTTQSEKGILND